MSHGPVYYNEFEPRTAAWLRQLIADGHLPAGDVDERSIEDVVPSDLRGYRQCHFFAGIGGWAHALALAGWPADRPVWTGSCPCQPFSSAGSGAGFADERHLWPAWFHLIAQCRPAVVFGEQVASAAGHGWIDLVQSDLEGQGYAVGHHVLGAHSVGAPHIRQRLWFVAHADIEAWRRPARQPISGDSAEAIRAGAPQPGRRSGARQLADVHGGGCSAEAGAGLQDAEHHAQPRSGLGSSNVPRLEVGSLSDDGGRAVRIEGAAAGPAEPLRGFWQGADWIACRDGKWRPVEPGTFPLAHGLPARVVRLRGYGNAIVPQVAAGFIAAAIEAWGDQVMQEAA